MTMTNPLIYEINGRMWLKNLVKKHGKRLDLTSLADRELKQFISLHVDYVWLMGLWHTGEKSLMVSRTHPIMQAVYQSTLPDYKTNDISGSPFAIAGYQPDRLFGSLTALKQFRHRLNTAGIKLILDFIPNHTGLDHPWLYSHPEYYLTCPEKGAYYQVYYEMTGLTIAHGRDPYFAPWTDTLQLDYTNRELRQQQIDILVQLADICDGVRCDMAMLVTKQIFHQTWGRIPDDEFWIKAISCVKQKFPDFIFIAEVYWDMEWQLQQMGFDYTYDKRLYDRLYDTPVPEIKNHLKADPAYQYKLVRFIENHDEPRAIRHLGDQKSLAAATVIYTLPGMRFLHQGQMEGYQIKIPVQLTRMPPEVENQTIKQYYMRLLNITAHDVFKKGCWQLEASSDHRLLYWTWYYRGAWKMVLINYSDQTLETNIQLPKGFPISSDFEFKDDLTDNTYQHRKEHLQLYGLYIKLASYQSHIFSIRAARTL
jgi:glycosidase